MTTYINIYGGPCTGKSALAASIFADFKKAGRSVELVTEFAKDLVWEDRQSTLANQPYVSMKQFRNLYRLKNKVDYVVTDSPLLKDIVYASIYAPQLSSSYTDLLVELDYDLGFSINILRSREWDYDPEGRNQTEEEADAIHLKIKKVLDEHVSYKELSDEAAIKKYLENVI